MLTAVKHKARPTTTNVEPRLFRQTFGALETSKVYLERRL
jgi:hypothetical protein